MIVKPPGDGSLSPLIRDINHYRFALENAVEEVDRLVFDPSMNGFDLYANEFDHLLLLQAKIEELGQAISNHGEELALILSEAILDAGGMIMTELGVALTCDDDGSITAVGMLDDPAEAESN